MNKSDRSLGKRSTNTASLSNAISSIKSSISPVIKTGRAPSNPKPLKANGEMWLPRTVRIYSSISTTSGSSDLVTNSIFANAGITGQIRILGLKVWNYSNQSSTTNYVRAEVQATVTETNVTTDVNDVGCGEHLPGVLVTVPRTIASNLTSSLTDVFVRIFAVPTGNPTSAQTMVTDVHFEYKTDTTN